MPIKKRVGKRRSDTAEPTEQEWAWLTCADDHNGFLGFLPVDEVREHGTPLRLKDLWQEYEDEVRALWRRDGLPEEIPYAHPVERALEAWGRHQREQWEREAAESPEDPPEKPKWLNRSARPDPRRLLGEPDPAEVRAYDEQVAAWREARREWFEAWINGQ